MIRFKPLILMVGLECYCSDIEYKGKRFMRLTDMHCQLCEL